MPHNRGLYNWGFGAVFLCGASALATTHPFIDGPVGATPYVHAEAMHLRCPPPPPAPGSPSECPSKSDHTCCIRAALRELRKRPENKRHLYVPKGVYVFSKSIEMFSGLHVRCANPQSVVFKSENASKWMVDGNLSEVSDISIERCSFDLNGTVANTRLGKFSSMISISATGSITPESPAGEPFAVKGVTISGNKIFDSAHPGRMCSARRLQRQHILVLNAEKVLIEKNSLSEGGRIKFGRPGRQALIRDNVIRNVNDNGITIVDKDRDGEEGVGRSVDGFKTSEIVIEGNRIYNPTVVGVFFGTDGQSSGDPKLGIERVLIRNNKIEGNFRGCIRGTLQNTASKILILNNTCIKTAQPDNEASAEACLNEPPYQNKKGLVDGISLGRTNLAQGDDTYIAHDITVMGNSVESRPGGGAYSSGVVIGAEFRNVCLLSNSITDNLKHSLYLTSNVEIYLSENKMNSAKYRCGRFSADCSSNKILPTAQCYAPGF